MAYYQFQKWKKYNGDGTFTGTTLVGNIISNTLYNTQADCEANLPWEPGDIVLSSAIANYTYIPKNISYTQDINNFSPISSWTVTASSIGNKSVAFNNGTTFQWVYRDLITGATDSTIHSATSTDNKYFSYESSYPNFPHYIDASGNITWIRKGYGSSDMPTVYNSVYPDLSFPLSVSTGQTLGMYIGLVWLKDENTVFWTEGGAVNNPIWYVSKMEIDWANNTSDITRYELSHLPAPYTYCHTYSMNMATGMVNILALENSSDLELKMWTLDLNTHTLTNTGHKVTSFSRDTQIDTSGFIFYYYSPTNDSIILVRDNDVDTTNYVLDQMHQTRANYETFKTYYYRYSTRGSDLIHNAFITE